MTNSHPIKLLAALLILAVLFVLPTCTPKKSIPVNTSSSYGGGWELPDGQRASLSDYKGKVLLLDFYATWCGPCRVETPHLVSLHKKYGAQGFEIIGLNVGGEDDYDQVPAFKQEFRIEFPLAIPDDDFVDQYLGLNQNIPQTFVINRQGQLVKHFVGYDEELAPEMDSVIQAALNK
ncbi:MAG TPA: TlpA disulfide reductase family protein [Pyrinomonadaceae bacterium]|jgi:thiol-disulfide isomerase/thioredoxin